MDEIIQDPRDCTYAFFGPDSVLTFDPRRLTVLARRSLELRGFILDAAIIGESHFAIIRRTDTEAPLCAELIACVDISELGMWPDVLHWFSADDEFSFARGDMRYGDRCRIMRVRSSVGIRRAGSDRNYYAPNVTPVDARLELTKSFPGDSAPRTIVHAGVRRNADGIFVWIATLHEYAVQDRIVPLVSSTTIALPHAHGR